MSTNWQLKWSFVCCPFVNYKLLLQFTFVSGSQQSFRYHVDTLWGRFIEGQGKAASCRLLRLLVCVSVCVCAAMFYVQVFNIVFDEVISICCLMNCNGWLCHQITIALLEFHWYIEGGVRAGAGTFGNDNKHCYRHHCDRRLIALARISLVIDVNMQSLQKDSGTWREGGKPSGSAQWHRDSCEAQVLSNSLCKCPRAHVLGQLKSSFDFYCLLKERLFYISKNI